MRPHAPEWSRRIEHGRDAADNEKHREAAGGNRPDKKADKELVIVVADAIANPGWQSCNHMKRFTIGAIVGE
jgi:hypothetical protein